MPHRIETLCQELDAKAVSLAQADRYYSGTQPLAYLAPGQRRALSNRLQTVNANYCRVVTHAVADRLHVEGFTRDGENLDRVWQAWAASGMPTGHRRAVLEALIAGRSYVTVWASRGKPTITVDSAAEMLHKTDPLTGELTLAFKRIVKDGRGYAVLLEPDKIIRYEGPEAPSGMTPTTGWRVAEILPNPLGVVPVVPLVNSHRLLDDGTPQSAPIWALQDLLSKLMSDLAVASEAASLPRRWATGLALDIDDDGDTISPFSDEPGTVAVSERADTKFGEWNSPDLRAYNDAIGLVIRQIGSVGGVPEMLLGIESPDPSSAEQIRAAMLPVISAVLEKQRLFSTSFERIAALVEAVQTDSNTLSDGISVVWRDAEDQTFSQLSDGLSKLYAAGLLPLEEVWRKLGYAPDEMAELRRMRLTSRIEGVAA